jgi:transposase
MGKSKPPKVHRYSMHFKATAVRLSDLPDVLIQDVAEALDIHPFMLSRWRKQAREGLIVTKGVKLDDETVAELKRLRDLEKKYKDLQQCIAYNRRWPPACELSAHLSVDAATGFRAGRRCG